jgi:hypothetical protein
MTKIACTMDSESVSIVYIAADGKNIHIIYVDSSNNLAYKLKKSDYTDSNILATSATIS